MAEYRPVNYTRRTLTGLSDVPQGASGISRLAATAYAAMAAAAWRESDAKPHNPVHDYDRSAPQGDAFKACWGYSADDRTEQGAAGAVCYSYKLPEGSYTVTAVAVPVIGDRYLDLGATLAVIASSDATPPSWADCLAAADRATGLCRTDAQEGVAPNDRVPQTETAEVALTDAAEPGQWLHLVLMLDDYLAVRGAWIEGSAMLDPGGLSMTVTGAAPSEPGNPGYDLMWVAPTYEFDQTMVTNRGCLFAGVHWPQRFVHAPTSGATAGEHTWTGGTRDDWDSLILFSHYEEYLEPYDFSTPCSWGNQTAQFGRGFRQFTASGEAAKSVSGTAVIPSPSGNYRGVDCVRCGVLKADSEPFVCGAVFGAPVAAPAGTRIREIVLPSGVIMPDGMSIEMSVYAAGSLPSAELNAPYASINRIASVIPALLDWRGLFSGTAEKIAMGSYAYDTADVRLGRISADNSADLPVTPVGHVIIENSLPNNTPIPVTPFETERVCTLVIAFAPYSFTVGGFVPSMSAPPCALIQITGIYAR